MLINIQFIFILAIICYYHIIHNKARVLTDFYDPHVCTDILFEEKHDLKKLVRLPLKANWALLAIQLDLPKHKIDEIAAATNPNNPGYLTLCLTDVFVYWMNNVDAHTFSKLKNTIVSMKLTNQKEVLESLHQLYSKLHGPAN